ncbi:MAG: hypothetical protein QM520_00465 [Gammaproteobacteria bacterium]|nr:hypothetical protein [Gammaproteobacteria bacterium]
MDILNKLSIEWEALKLQLTREFLGRLNGVADELGGLNTNPLYLKGTNDQYDAFRHAYTSALVTGIFEDIIQRRMDVRALATPVGEFIAKWLGDRNEGPYDPNGKHKGMTLEEYNAEKNMDLWSNHVGREAYKNWRNAVESGTTTQSLAKWIYDQVKEGMTINDPIDHRVWQEPDPFPQGDPFTGMPWPWGAGGDFPNGYGAAGGMGTAGCAAGLAGTIPPMVRRPFPEGFGDPLALDLDGDGIETTSLRDGTVILFDQNADGVKTGTGWVKSDDGWLVLDRNGTIDSGRELFGVDTLKSNGQLATDGFDALKDLDANQDGKIDAADSVFASLRIWRDLNQDGTSQAEELTTLSAHHIVSIGVNSRAVRTNLGNGNVLTADATFTRTDGSIGTTATTQGMLANLELLLNPFYRSFTHQITLTNQAKALPNLRGSGRVRDLGEAISLSTDLGNWVQTYIESTTRQGQIDQLDGFIDRWADTADMKPLKAQATALSASGVSLTYNLAGMAADNLLDAEDDKKSDILLFSNTHRRQESVSQMQV